MSYGVPGTPDKTKEFQVLCSQIRLNHAIAQLYHAADVSNGGEPTTRVQIDQRRNRFSKNRDAPFESILKSFNTEPTDQNATELTQMLLEVADTYPRETNGILPITDKSGYSD